MIVKWNWFHFSFFFAAKFLFKKKGRCGFNVKKKIK